MLSQVNKEILADKNFHKLVTARRWVSWSFLFVLLSLYLVFGLLSAYAPQVLARPVFTGGVVPFGIAMGYGILALTFIMTLVYVRIANRYFAPLERKIITAIGARKRAMSGGKP